MPNQSNQALVQESLFSQPNVSLEVYQSFMTSYVRRINDATLRVSIGGVRVGSAKYSRLAQINLQTKIITFSRYAIENVPERGRRYLVIHELAHVIEPSHNKRFWKLVERWEPDYRHVGKAIQLAFTNNVKRSEPARKQLETGFSLNTFVENAKLLFDPFINNLGSVTSNYQSPPDNRGSNKYLYIEDDSYDESVGIIHGGSDNTNLLSDLEGLST